MNNSQKSRLSVIAVTAASLLAVGVVTTISMTEEADARNWLSQSNSVSITQSATSSGGIASNSATVSQSNTASQSGGSSSSSSSSTVCENGECTTTTTP
jgi:hypothetical protein